LAAVDFRQKPKSTNWKVGEKQGTGKSLIKVWPASKKRQKMQSGLVTQLD